MLSGEHPPREVHGGGAELAFDDRVDDAQGVCLGDWDERAPDDHFERRADSDEARQSLRAAGAGQNAERHLGQAELGPGCGHAIVARERQLEPATEGRAVQRRHHRLLECIEELDDVRQVGCERRAPELLDVGSGDESPSRAGNDQRRDLGATEHGGRRNQVRIAARSRMHDDRRAGGTPAPHRRGNTSCAGDALAWR